MDKPAFGSKVKVSAVYKRRQRSAMDGSGMMLKWWKPVALSQPRDGLYIGRRTLADGKSDYIGAEEGTVFCADKHFPAALVVFNERERPVLVPIDAIESE